MSADHDLFKKWYLDPLRALETITSGHGGFVALGTACFLYERYAVAVLTSKGKKADTVAKVSQLCIDFNVDEETANAFWAVIRDGMLHQGMPKQVKDLPRWAFHGLYPTMKLDIVDNQPFLKVHPWKFTYRVLELWESHFDLLRSSGSFPWATIGTVPA